MSVLTSMHESLIKHGMTRSDNENTSLFSSTQVNLLSAHNQELRDQNDELTEKLRNVDKR